MATKVKVPRYKCPNCVWIGTLEQAMSDGTNCEVKRCPKCAEPVNLKNSIKVGSGEEKPSKGDAQWETLTDIPCPECKKHELWARVSYKHRTVVADCEACKFHGKVENPNFNYDKKVEYELIKERAVLSLELQEVVDAVFYNTEREEKHNTEYSMYLLRESQMSHPKVFFPLLEEMRRQAVTMLHVVTNFGLVFDDQYFTYHPDSVGVTELRYLGYPIGAIFYSHKKGEDEWWIVSHYKSEEEDGRFTKEGAMNALKAKFKEGGF